MVFSKIFEEAWRVTMETAGPKFEIPIQLQTKSKTILTTYNVSSEIIRCLLIESYYMYRKIPKISPGLYFSKDSFDGLIFGGGLYTEGLIFRGPYIQRSLYTEELMKGGKFAFRKNSTGLINGGKFLSAIFQCENDNIRTLTRN